MSSKKSAVKNLKPDAGPEEPSEPPVIEAATEQPEPQAPEPSPPLPEPPTPSEPPDQPLTLESLHHEIQSLKSTIAELQQTLARKRKPPVSNGKVQIRDKQTGQVYPSKNNAYQSLLKSGELKALVDKGVFGDIPEKNTFGWYVLNREWPERFEEVPEGLAELPEAK